MFMSSVIYTVKEMKLTSLSQSLILQERRSEFESAGAVGIEMPKFDAKKGDFAKIWQKLGEL